MCLLIVGYKVLEGGRSTAALNTPDDLSGEDTAQVRVLGEAFEAPAVEGTADDVDGRAEPDMSALGLTFTGKELAGTANEIGVPCGA